MASDIQAYLAKLTSGEIAHPGKDATPQDIVNGAKAAGFNFTVEDLAKHAEDAELDSAGGGSCYFNMGDVSV